MGHALRPAVTTLASLIAQHEAHEQGYSQVLWLDGVEKKYIEEVGAMNIFFVIDNEIVTPELVGSILPGITESPLSSLLDTRDIRLPREEFLLMKLLLLTMRASLMRFSELVRLRLSPLLAL